jgi:superfamily II DNA helicase RecQ
LTATATPLVQDDIAQQLGLDQPLRSIQGFRRKNIAIEVVEVARAARRDAVYDILRDPSRRPGIIYVPTRTDSDSLADDLGRFFKTEPYHAGLRTDRRQQVQERFLGGELEVIVATIAFGMGIDKSDIRTVIHTALPGSTEAYYQEIGRAGRDGQPSRAILMHSYADRHRHDFFFNRDYPEVAVVDGLYKLLKTQPVGKQELLEKSKLDEDTFEKALDKLWVHGGAVIDPEENVARGAGKWRDAYLNQGEHRSAQLEVMLRYAAATQCRMAALVRHFGDRTDTQAWCGMCDFCAPEECIAQHFRDPTFAEERAARDVMAALEGGFAKSTGKLHTEICTADELDRNSFEELLAALTRAGLVALADAVFEKDGKNIPYRTVRLTREGADVDLTEPMSFKLRRSGRNLPEKRTRAKKIASAAGAVSEKVVDPADEALLQALRAWRLAEAKSKNVPAFRVFTDKVLRQLAEDRPKTEEDLLAIAGVGPGFSKRYGAEIFKIVMAAERDTPN